MGLLFFNFVFTYLSSDSGCLPLASRMYAFVLCLKMVLFPSNPAISLSNPSEWLRVSLASWTSISTARSAANGAK